MRSLLFPDLSSSVKFIDDVFGAHTASAGVRAYAPACDVLECEKSYMIHVDLPGFAKSDITIDYQNGVLSIAGKRERGAVDTKPSFHLDERDFGAFRRSFVIKDIDASAIEAQFEQGVLSIHVPKRAEAQAKRIAIKDANPGSTVPDKLN